MGYASNYRRLKYAYKRVSTVGQNTVRQLAEVDIEFDYEFTDKLSAKDKDRPQLNILLDLAKEGDEIHVHSLDRLARNVKDLIEIVTQLNDKGVLIVFHKENLRCEPESMGSMGRLILTILGAVAEFEREIINERIREGVAIAKKEGKFKGRTADMRLKSEIKSRLKEEQKVATIAKELKTSETTVYRVRKELLAESSVEV